MMTDTGKFSMKRALLLFRPFCLPAAVSLIAAQQQRPAPLEMQKVKDNLYVITGGGGNAALSLPKALSSSA
jgi:hypothetical protein